MTFVNTESVRNFIKTQAKYMKKHEISYSLQILKQMDYKLKKTNTLKYFRWLRRKDLKHHKKVAKFAFDIFETCGAKYKSFKIDVIID